MAGSAWRDEVLCRLVRRNELESAFAHLITSHAHLAQTSQDLQSQNSSLSFINGRLRQENTELKALNAVSNDQVELTEKYGILEKKLFKVQEELTELHRRKGDNAQQVIDLTAQLKISDNELADKEAKLKDNEDVIKRLKEELDKLGENMRELQETNQLLKDEYQTLQLALTSSESKLVEVKKENDRLIEQIMEFKAQDVMRMNQENDVFDKMKQQQVQQQLREAAEEKNPPIIIPDK